MKNFFFGILACMLLFSSCKEDPGSLILNFKPVYGQDDLILLEPNTYSENADISFSALQFYISDVELVKSDGTSQRLADIELVDVGASTQAAAENGTDLVFNGIEAGEYDFVRFSIGVPSDLNEMKPTDFSADNDLSNTAFYWDNWQSYIFSKTEGMLDTLKNGTFDMGWIVHTGKSSLLRSFSTPQTVSIPEGGENRIFFIMDFKRLLQDTNGAPFNLKEKPINHHQNDTARIKMYVDNYAQGIQVIQ